MSCLPQYPDIQIRDFYNFPLAFYSMFSVGLNVYGAYNYQEIATAAEHWRMFWVMFFSAIWHMYMMSLIVAQLCQRYNEVHVHAMGRARLLCGNIIFETAMPLISKKRWAAFVSSLKLDEACELDEGDIGPKGAVQVLEAPEAYMSHASLSHDRVIRFGGLASPTLPWPEHGDNDSEDPVVKLEKLVTSKFNQLEQLMNNVATSIGKLSQEKVALYGQETIADEAQSGEGEDWYEDVTEEVICARAAE